MGTEELLSLITIVNIIFGMLLWIVIFAFLMHIRIKKYEERKKKAMNGQ